MRPSARRRCVGTVRFFPLHLNGPSLVRYRTEWSPRSPFDLCEDEELFLCQLACKRAVTFFDVNVIIIVLAKLTVVALFRLLIQNLRG